MTLKGFQRFVGGFKGNLGDFQEVGASVSIRMIQRISILSWGFSETFQGFSGSFKAVSEVCPVDSWGLCSFRTFHGSFRESSCNYMVHFSVSEALQKVQWAFYGFSNSYFLNFLLQAPLKLFETP